jgi:hypothetical protein
MDVTGILLGFASGVAGLALWLLVIEPRLRGRLSTYEYHAYLRSPEWADLCARFGATRRGSRCAACGTTEDLAEPHHISYQRLGNEPLWHLVRLCKRHHTGRWSVHVWSEWLFSSRTRGLWLTTALVCGAGKARRLGRRVPQPSRTA